MTVLERGDLDTLRGSTGYAPGFIGLYKDAPALTDLALASAALPGHRKLVDAVDDHVVPHRNPLERHCEL